MLRPRSKTNSDVARPSRTRAYKGLQTAGSLFHIHLSTNINLRRIEIKGAGEKTILNPGRITVKGSKAGEVGRAMQGMIDEPKAPDRARPDY